MKKKNTKIRGNANRPRLYVFRSNKHIYAQIIDDNQNKILITKSSLSYQDNNKSIVYANCETAKMIGKLVAEACLEQGIQKIVFDRGDKLYHGRIKALAESARSAGIKF
uniref:Large ribosomal subunit protein uL18c n=1 Tax=Hommersandiophycus borowitzkae TaxID=268573 RepID=A0A1G4NUA3_9FLOR|nr:Ribosomal protein L18 [Hommersandiophycus borowitzkae]SCW22217.1 Ribosomal protein L18 [Hommersandiophycus borowitzkae]